MEVGLTLVVDIGNTRTKCGLFRGHRLVRTFVVPGNDASLLATALIGPAPEAIVVGSVARQDDPVVDLLCGIAPVLEVKGDSSVPIKNSYSTRHTLGVDRLANAVGAHFLFPDRPVLVIDAGTCITYDLVDAGGVYAGGAISPGASMRARSLHAYSARLPLVVPHEAPALLGTDTEGSIQAGIHHGIVSEMHGMIEAHGQHRSSMAVTITGGDAVRYTRALKSGIFAHPYLTLLGLYAILIHDRGRLGTAASLGAGAGKGPGATG